MILTIFFPSPHVNKRIPPVFCFGALICITAFLHRSNNKEITNRNDVKTTSTRIVARVDANRMVSEVLRDPSKKRSAKTIENNIRAYDGKALHIATMAHNKSHPINERAVDCVKTILKNYYPDDADKVAQIVYQPSVFGMEVRRVGEGEEAKGILSVGYYSVAQMPASLAAEVLRVGHELQHIDQYRRGLTPNEDNEKEFLAFTWEAQAMEFPGTGTISHTKRINLCDEAIKYYNKLSKLKQTEYKDKKENLEGIKRVHIYFLNKKK